MTKLYALIGALLVLSTGYANFTGWTFIDALRTGKWGPNGKATRLRHK